MASGGEKLVMNVVCKNRYWFVNDSQIPGLRCADKALAISNFGVQIDQPSALTLETS